MRLRQAKKILFSFNMKQFKRFQELRPEYYDEETECWISPSWHDIGIIARASTRYQRYLRKGENNGNK